MLRLPGGRGEGSEAGGRPGKPGRGLPSATAAAAGQVAGANGLLPEDGPHPLAPPPARRTGPAGAGRALCRLRGSGADCDWLDRRWRGRRRSGRGRCPARRALRHPGVAHRVVRGDAALWVTLQEALQKVARAGRQPLERGRVERDGARRHLGQHLAGAGSGAEAGAGKGMQSGGDGKVGVQGGSTFARPICGPAVQLHLPCFLSLPVAQRGGLQGRGAPCAMDPPCPSTYLVRGLGTQVLQGRVRPVGEAPRQQLEHDHADAPQVRRRAVRQARSAFGGLWAEGGGRRRVGVEEGGDGPSKRRCVRAGLPAEGAASAELLSGGGGAGAQWPLAETH
jgi:hypothetical protein